MALDVRPLPIPPRPHSAGSYHHERLQQPPTEPPPIPPLPPDFRPYGQDILRPKSTEPFFAPQAQRPMRDLYSTIPCALDERFIVSHDGLASFASVPPPPQQQKEQGQMNDHVSSIITSDSISFRGRSPAFSRLPYESPPPLPTGSAWHGESSADVGSVASLMAAASLNESPPSRNRSVHTVVEYVQPPISRPMSSPPAGGPLAAPLPNVATLENALSSVLSPSANVLNRVAWIRDVLLLVNRAYASEQDCSSPSALPLASNNLPSGPIKISDVALRRLAHSAVSLLISIIPSLPRRDEKLTPPLVEALYIRATLTASGAFPELIAASPRNAFREFEIVARADFARAWFRLGRDYEGFDNVARARQCFDRGVAAGDPGCIYRVGMAKLLGQLGFPANNAEGVENGARLLHQAATLATIYFPHPPYVFALFLLGEFDKVSVPADVLAAYIPPGSSAVQQARRHLERAAFLHFAPAQQRVGRAYEFADPPFLFDPFLSMKYYSLASAGGDAEADLALSKWYLCGADGFFGKDEMLARNHAARAASRRLPAAMFALGYCCEVGIGAPSDVNRARQLYEDAAALGDADAQGRLKALTDTPIPLSREQHDTLAETRLVRSRTQARLRSGATMGNFHRSGQTIVPQQQQGQAYQRRQASLPTQMLPADQYGFPVQSAQHRPPPQHSTNHPPRLTNGHSSVADHTSLPIIPGLAREQHLTHRPRYSLVDPGVVQPTSGTISPPPRIESHRSASVGTPLPSIHRQHSGQTVTFSSPQGSPLASVSSLPPETIPAATDQRTGTTRYNTFADMGIEGKRAEDKECRIM